MMSRTYAFGTPTRRSRRLLKNGYYRVQTEETSMLDMSASDDDDTTSVESSVSRVSDQRKVTYKESPPKNFNQYKRRPRSRSPRRISNSLIDLSQQKVHKNTSYSESQLHRLLVYKTSSAVTHTEQSTMNSSNLSIGSGTKHQEIGDIPQAHVSSVPQVRSRLTHKRRVTQHTEDGADGDGTFKVPHAKTAVNVSSTRTKLQEQSLEYSLSDEDFLDNGNSSNSASPLEETATNGWYFYLFSVALFCKSLFVSLVWNTGRFFYQAATKLLVFDTWLLSTTVIIRAYFKRYFKIAVFCLFLGVCIFLLLSGLPSLLARRQDAQKELPVSHTSDESVVVTVESGQDIKEVQQNIKSLEVSLRALESSFSQRYVSMLDAVSKVQTSNEEKNAKRLKTQEEMMSNVEMIIAKSIKMELSKISEKFEGKISILQLELKQIRDLHTVNEQYLRDMDAKYESDKQSRTPNTSHLNGVEKRLIQVEKRVSELVGEYNAFKVSVNRYSGNATYLRQLSNEQFIENFQIILKESTDLEGEQTDAGGHNYLARVFVTWLEKRGFIQKDAMIKLKSEIISNSTRIENHFKTALESGVTELKSNVFDELHKTTINIVAQQQQQKQAYDTSEITTALIKVWIKEALDLYSADRIGEADFALESAGGSVVNTRCSSTYNHKTALVSLLGIPIYYNVNTPRSVIQPTVLPGECWAFQGEKGFVVISLSTTVRPTKFTLEHIPVALSLTKNISSAPKDFSVYGLTTASDLDGVLLGTYRYDKEREPVQQFSVQSEALEIKDGFSHIELRVSSNWGHPQFTCIYRFRVHGDNLK